MNAKTYGFDVENTLRLLTQLFPANASASKPTLFHSIRVGTWLYTRNYPRDVVLAGYLHDVIEDTVMTESDLSAIYTPAIASLVAANSMDTRIIEPLERRRELIFRAVAHSEPAAIIKAADIVDNYVYYLAQDDKHGLEYCRFNARTMLDHLPAGYTDKIFAELHSTVLLAEQLQQTRLVG